MEFDNDSNDHESNRDSNEVINSTTTGHCNAWCWMVLGDAGFMLAFDITATAHRPHKTPISQSKIVSTSHKAGSARTSRINSLEDATRYDRGKKVLLDLAPPPPPPHVPLSDCLITVTATATVPLPPSLISSPQRPEFQRRASSKRGLSFDNTGVSSPSLKPMPEATTDDNVTINVTL